jgi:hypothetical protein
MSLDLVAPVDVFVYALELVAFLVVYVVEALQLPFGLRMDEA